MRQQETEASREKDLRVDAEDRLKHANLRLESLRGDLSTTKQLVQDFCTHADEVVHGRDLGYRDLFVRLHSVFAETEEGRALWEKACERSSVFARIVVPDAPVVRRTQFSIQDGKPYSALVEASEHSRQQLGAARE